VPCSKILATKCVNATCMPSSVSGSPEAALTSSAESDFLAMETRWLSLAHSYELAERLSNYTAPFGKRKRQKE
jgi:hypothetical protein